MGYGATFGILGGGGMAPLPPPAKSAYAYNGLPLGGLHFESSRRVDVKL